MTLRLSRRSRQAARRRGDVLDGRSGRAVARQGAPARSAAELHRRARRPRWRRATRATWRSASSRSRRCRAATPASTNGAPTTTSRCARISRRCRSICRKSSVGADGVAKIKVKLPDSLTVFKLRAKAISGPDRFGFATGEMLIRQELVAQPALPRFVRPGDTFDAGLIGRVVEGPAGTGRASHRGRRADARRAPASSASPGSRTGRRASISRDRRQAAAPGNDAGAAALSLCRATPIRPPTPCRSICRCSPTARRCASMISSRSRRAAVTSLPALADGRRGRAPIARSITLAADPALVRLVAGARTISSNILTAARSSASRSPRRRSRSSPSRRCSPPPGSTGSSPPMSHNTLAGDRAEHRCRRSGGVLAASARQCLADRLGL